MSYILQQRPFNVIDHGTGAVSELMHNPLSKQTCFLEESALRTQQPQVGYTRRYLTTPLPLPNGPTRRCGFQRRDTGRNATTSLWNSTFKATWRLSCQPSPSDQPPPQPWITFPTCKLLCMTPPPPLGTLCVVLTNRYY